MTTYIHQTQALDIACHHHLQGWPMGSMGSRRSSPPCHPFLPAPPLRLPTLTTVGPPCFVSPLRGRSRAGFVGHTLAYYHLQHHLLTTTAGFVGTFRIQGSWQNQWISNSAAWALTTCVTNMGVSCSTTYIYMLQLRSTGSAGVSLPKLTLPLIV